MASFIREYQSVSAATPGELAAARTRVFQKWLSESARELFDELRALHPVFALPNALVLSRNADVADVLRHDSHFSVAAYRPKIDELAGAFVLGMDPGPAYEKEISLLRLAASRADVERVGSFVRGEAEGRVARADGRLDLVRDLSRAIPTRVVEDYFGVPRPAGEHGFEELQDWLRTMFRHIFLNLGNETAVRDAALESGARANAHIDGLIGSETARGVDGAEGPDTVLRRLVRLSRPDGSTVDPIGVRRNIAGLVIGAVDTTSKFIALAVEELLRRPEALEAAREAARSRDIEKLRRILYEASRFSPQNAILYRICTREFTVGAGRPFQTVIAPGTFVFLGTQSAMMDPDVVPDAATFRTDREWGDALLFGDGMHACFGRYLNAVTIPEICAPLLAKSGLRATGPMAWDGPFPDSLGVAWTV